MKTTLLFPVALLFLAQSVSSITVGVGSGGPGTFLDLSAQCCGGCVNFAVSIPAGATSAIGDATVTISTDGDFGTFTEDISITAADTSFDFGTWQDGDPSNDIFVSDADSAPDCTIEPPTSGTIPQADFNAMISDGSIDLLISVDSDVNCLVCGGSDVLLLLDFDFVAGVGGGGDPHFTGMHGQKYFLPLEPQRVYNLVSSSRASVNCRTKEVPSHLFDDQDGTRVYMDALSLRTEQGLLSVEYAIDGTPSVVAEGMSLALPNSGATLHHSVGADVWVEISSIESTRKLSQFDGSTFMEEHFKWEIPYVQYVITFRTPVMSIQAFLIDVHHPHGYVTGPPRTSIDFTILETWDPVESFQGLLGLSAKKDFSLADLSERVSEHTAPTGSNVNHLFFDH